jgi:hypothetical protein
MARLPRFFPVLWQLVVIRNFCCAQLKSNAPIEVLVIDFFRQLRHELPLNCEFLSAGRGSFVLDFARQVGANSLKRSN